MNCFNNRACHTIPLWRSNATDNPNVTTGLLDQLSQSYGQNVSAEELFCYCYAVLASPIYVETYSEELAISGPRIPFTRDSTMFHEAAGIGHKLVWLHTFCERCASGNRRHVQIPQGRARCRSSISNRKEEYPESFHFDPVTLTLHVGLGKFSPVSQAVWDFSVSGLAVLESWLNYRKKAGAGRSSSDLDNVRPERWTGDLTQELLELIWILEETLATFPAVDSVFRRIIAGEMFREIELPSPTPAESRPPELQTTSGQHQMEF